jgi:cob(I)alamin adenosyltransferase
LEGKAWVQEIQKNLVLLMGCVALVPEDFERYDQSAIHKPEKKLLSQIEKRIDELEKQGIQFEKWSHPQTRLTTAWHLARTGTRHAERSLQILQEQHLLHPAYASLLIQTLNRLSDLFWLEAKSLSDRALDSSCVTT